MRALAVVIFLIATGASGDEKLDAPTVALLDRIEHASVGVKSLSASFVQKNHLKLFKQDVTTTGRLVFERPRRIRWEYLAPDASLMVLDGDHATLRSPGEEPRAFDLSKDATMRAVFDQLLLFLGAGSVKDAAKDYAMHAQGGSLILTPHPGSTVAKAFARIELGFDKELVLSVIALREANGDEKRIELTGVKRNGAIAADAFKL